MTKGLLPWSLSLNSNWCNPFKMDQSIITRRQFFLNELLPMLNTILRYSMHAPSQAHPVCRACQRDKNRSLQWPRRLHELFFNGLRNANLAYFFLKVFLTVLLS